MLFAVLRTTPARLTSSGAACRLAASSCHLTTTRYCSSRASSSSGSAQDHKPTSPQRNFSSTTTMASKDAFQRALENNARWASKTAQDQPNLFPALAAGQSPEILWIGCADSRCPETSFLGLGPGDVFVHRNIANVIQHSDLSAASVVEYAVVHLKVKHVVVCGHTSCGGVAAALANNKLGLLDTWLMPLRRLREENLKTLTSLPQAEAALKLTELNVIDGLRVLKEKSSVQEAIQERGLKLHGAIYDVGSGKVRELDTEESSDAASARLAAFKTA